MTLADRWTPRASRGTRLFLAALVWSGVGCGLLVAGLRWIFSATAPALIAAVPVAVAIGWVKGRFILGARAEANARWILHGESSRCIGATFPWSSWGIAVIMMAGGMALRRSSVPRQWLGLLYCAIGVALLTASMRSWSQWRAHRF